jgi:2-oxoglutarate/2-oxoacid ferredoxin oxidoreductase subunit beta
MSTSTLIPDCCLSSDYEQLSVEDYGRGVPRWCAGCGDHAILAAVQRFCRDEQLPPEKTVCVSGIGCSSRFPHYMETYGFHGIHGRALPIAQGIKMARPDLNVFVSTGDGDCCSIGTAHWIHAIRYNMNMTVLLHDNEVYGLTKKQASPTSPRGLKTNTTPRGAYLHPLNPLSATLGVANASFVAQAVDWIPDLLHEIIRMAYHHRGFSFIRILQRCPAYLPNTFDSQVKDPSRVLLLRHKDGLDISPAVAQTYRNQEEHNPRDIDRAREIASSTDPIPVGILYRNPDVPCYEDARDFQRIDTPETTQAALEREMDKFTIWPGS